MPIIHAFLTLNYLRAFLTLNYLRAFLTLNYLHTIKYIYVFLYYKGYHINMDFFGSEKYFNNRTPNSVRRLERDIECKTPTDWFMECSNRKYLHKRIQLGGLNIDEISLMSAMNIWAKKKKINALFNADFNVTNNQDNTTVVGSINKEFLNHMNEKHGIFNSGLSNKANIRQYKEKQEDDYVIQDGILQKTSDDSADDRIVSKKFSEMTVNDFRNLDVYDPSYDRDLYVQTIGLGMQRSRRNNIQKYMHKRNTDYELDGLQAKDSDRASLDNLVRGYDMSEYVRHANSRKKPISRHQIQ